MKFISQNGKGCISGWTQRLVSSAALACCIAYSGGAKAITNNRVVIDPNQYENWLAAGTLSDPYIVTRDNLHIYGTFPWNFGNTSQGYGTYSHTYTWSDMALRESSNTGTPETIRPSTSGSASFARIRDSTCIPRSCFGTTGQESSFTTIYEALQTHAIAGVVPSHDERTYFKLASDVYVVPVVVVSWIRPGNFVAQDYRADAAALIDFMPFQANSLWTTPNSQDGYKDPEANETPPDDVWTQCGIQIQVVANFNCYTDQTTGSCLEASCTARFAVDVNHQTSARDACLLSALYAQGFPDPQATRDLITLLDPIYLEYGLWNCPYVKGEACTPSDTIQVTTTAPGAYTTAHELGHELLNTNSHENDPNNLMHTNANHGELTNAQCDIARQSARTRSNLFRDYNSKVGRTPYPTPMIRPQNPYASVDNAFTNICCVVNGVASFGPAGVCNLLGGTIETPSECTECCRTMNPLAYSSVGLGSCNGDVVPKPQCNPVCCEVDNVASYMAAGLCAELGGMLAANPLDCGRPR